MAYVPGTFEWSRSELLAFVGLLVAAAVTEVFCIPLRHGSETENFSQIDVVFTAGLLLAPHEILVLAGPLGCLIGEMARRFPPLKIAFNAGMYVLALTVARFSYDILGVHNPSEPSTWVAAAASMVLFMVLNEAAVGAVISSIERQPIATIVLPSLRITAIHSAGNIAIGILAAVLWSREPASLVLVALPFAMTYAAYRGWIRSMEERDRMREIARTAETISLEKNLSKRVPDDAASGDVGHLARTFNLMLDRLEDGLRRERLFINEASHELRTPITICSGYLELIGADSTREEIDEAVGVVSDELDRMTRMVEELTVLARIGDPEFVHLEEVELERFLHVLASKTAPIADNRLKILPAPKNEIVRVDSQRMLQALINLIRNATVHSNHSTPIELRVVPGEDEWRYEVADHGDGIPPGQEERIFEPFCRVDQRRPGSGLGLAIVRGIAKAHGGRAGVDNRPGEGATFWMALPR